MGIPAGSTHMQEFSGPNVSLAEAVPGCPAPVVLSAEMQALIARPDCYDVVWTDLLGNVLPFYAERTPDVWWMRVPELPAGTTGTPLVRCYVGDPAAVDQSNAAATVAGYTAWYDLNEASGNFADRVGAYPGVASNIEAYGVAGKVDGAARFNGNNSNVNLGDVTQLNSAQKVSATWWAAQDVIGASDYAWFKSLGGSKGCSVATQATNTLIIRWYNGSYSYATFVYGAPSGGPVAAGVEAHYALIFDGTQPDNEGRLKLYINGEQRTLAFTGTIAATTADLATAPFYIGYTAGSWDGILDGFRIHLAARTAWDILAEAQATALLTGGDIVPISTGGQWGRGTVTAGVRGIDFSAPGRTLRMGQRGVR